MTNDGTIIRLRNVYKLPKCKMEPSIDPKTGRLPEHIIELKPDGSTFREAETEKKAKQMNLTPLPKLPVSKCAKPIMPNMAVISFR